MPELLSEMSNEELWALFPVIIKEYNADYPIWYGMEESLLADTVGKCCIERISHIGSTAVPGLVSKPIIDILLEIAEGCDIDRLVSAVKGNGYICTGQPDNPPPHLTFVKGYSIHGFEDKVFHLHVRYKGDWNELYFRDYLRVHSDIARQYGALKMELKELFEHDRDGYTDTKTDFVVKYTKLARKEFRNRYGR